MVTKLQMNVNRNRSEVLYNRISALQHLFKMYIFVVREERMMELFTHMGPALSVTVRIKLLPN